MITSNSTEIDQVLVEQNLGVRTIILNRHKQLNALSSQMVLVEHNSSVRTIILNRPKQLNALSSQMGKGRAFCAGGDVAAVVRDIKEGNWKLGAKYFWKEFILNYVMATYNKPQVFAMPETALGLFPDVGASYYLSRLPGFFREYVGLVGARLDGAEMLACGLATHFVPAERLSMLEEALNMVDSSDPTVISGMISEFSQYPNLKERSAYYWCFSRRTVEDILSALEIEAKNSKDDWISTTLQSLKKASPMSLKISLRSIREGRLRGVGECLVRVQNGLSCHERRSQQGFH
ncbi:hypothetical protein LguiB_012582 [Lonicera macranthoides]